MSHPTSDRSLACASLTVGIIAREESWSARYGERHRQYRITEFPAGIVAPKKVRLYRRQQHFILQWWDPAAKATLSDRVDGDLVAALSRARAIDERLENFRTSGRMHSRRRSHLELVDQFIADLQRRADAREIVPATVRRYAAALRYYQEFCAQSTVAKDYPFAANVDRDFRLELTTFLDQCRIPLKRCPGPGALLKGQGFVLDTVRALYEWANDPDRGAALPEGFRNPFRRHSHARSILRGDPLAGPDITLSMALDLVARCDRFQLRLLIPMLLFGLRASEPCFLFAEYIEEQWLRVPCNADLGYRTKGRRDKRFPLLKELKPFWQELMDQRGHGLLYVRRSIHLDRQQAPLAGASLDQITAEFQRRCAAQKGLSAIDSQNLRNAVLREAGALNYDHIEGEFKALSRCLGWPTAATLKDLRHLFATTMNNATMPEPYRQYLMGQTPSKAPITAYTHLNELSRHYAAAVQSQWQPLVAAILQRLKEIPTGT